MKIFCLKSTCQFDLFYKQINTLLDEHAPIHKISNKELSLKKKPWIAKAFNHLWQNATDFSTYCQKSNPTLKLTKHNDYRRIRNIVVSTIKESKKQYYQNYFQRNSKKSQKNLEWCKISYNAEIQNQNVPKLLVRR